MLELYNNLTLAKLKRLLTILLIFSLIIFIYYQLNTSCIPGKYKISTDQRSRANKKDRKLKHLNETSQKHKSGDIAYVQKHKHGHADLRYLKRLTRDTRIDKEIIDIMGLPPIKFDPAFKNPCFKGDKKSGLFDDGKMHCLPYFYIIGVKKSGTSDLFRRISGHPEFRDPGFKESQWFNRIRFGLGHEAFSRSQIHKESRRKGIDNRRIKYFISLFDNATQEIERCSEKTHSGKYHNCITAEATPGNLHMHTRWKLLPGNEGLTKPRYTNFHYINHITPDAKIIIIFRDPVTRLFSDFLHEVKHRNLKISAEKTAEMFHKQASVLIKRFGLCFRLYSMRRCIYDEAMSDKLNKRGYIVARSFRASFYAFFMEELYSVFRKEQILTIKMKQYITETKETLAETFKFLGMSPLRRRQMSEIASFDVPNSSEYKTEMNEKTKDMLYEFFRPYNKKMARLMNDNEYLFPQS